MAAKQNLTSVTFATVDCDDPVSKPARTLADLETRTRRYACHTGMTLVMLSHLAQCIK